MSTRSRTTSSSLWVSYHNKKGAATTGKCPKAKCIENQSAVERLNELRISAMANPMSRYAQTVKRAMDNLAKCTTPITTRKEALEIKGVGPAIAKIIVKTDDVPSKSLSSSLSSSTTAAAPSLSRSNSIASSSSTSATTTTTTTTSRKRKATKTTTVINATDLKPQHSAKQKAYDKAVQEAKQLQLPAQNWKVILLIDGREQRAQHVQAKCQMSGLPCEQRHLPIGDMAWIAKSGSIEIMLGTIIERKEVSDLASSLFGTRYLEQRLRLQHSGLDQVLLLVEGNIHAVRNCPAKTLQYAMMETRVHLGFQVVQTQHLDDTVRFLKRIHRRLLQRTFPATFSDSADVSVPSFASPEQQRDHRRGRRRGKKKESLQEMILDDGPPKHPIQGKRFMTYTELKTKIERDREAGTRTVGHVYQAMLKQIPTLSNRKVMAIGQAYPTYQCLLQAYQDLPEEDGLSLVQDLSTNDGAERTCRIGPKSAAELYHICTQGGVSISCHDKTSKEEDGDDVDDSHNMELLKKVERNQLKDNDTVTAAVAKAPSPFSSDSPFDDDTKNYIDHQYQDIGDTPEKGSAHTGKERSSTSSLSKKNSAGDDRNYEKRTSSTTMSTMTSKNINLSILLEETEDEKDDAFTLDEQENVVKKEPAFVGPSCTSRTKTSNPNPESCVDLTQDDEDDRSLEINNGMNNSASLRLQQMITIANKAASGVGTLPVNNQLSVLDDKEISAAPVASTPTTTIATTTATSDTIQQKGAAISNSPTQPSPTKTSITSTSKATSKPQIKKRKLVTLEMASWDDDSSSNDDEDEPLIVRIQKQLQKPIPTVDLAEERDLPPQRQVQKPSNTKKHAGDSCNIEKQWVDSQKSLSERPSSKLTTITGHGIYDSDSSSDVDNILLSPPLSGKPRTNNNFNPCTLKRFPIETANESSNSKDDLEDNDSDSSSDVDNVLLSPPLSGKPRTNDNFNSCALKRFPIETADESSNSKDDLEDRNSSFRRATSDFVKISRAENNRGIGVLVGKKTSPMPSNRKESNTTSNKNDLQTPAFSCSQDVGQPRASGTSSQEAIEIIEIE